MSAKDDVCLLVNIRRLMVPSIESIASMQELKAGTSALIEHLEPLSSAREDLLVFCHGGEGGLQTGRSNRRIGGITNFLTTRIEGNCLLI